MGYADPDRGALREGKKSAVVAALTDSSGGVADDTLQAIGGAFNQAEIANNFADLAAKYNAMLTALKAAGLMKSA